MGTIKFEVPHGLPHADAKARVEALLGYWSRKYGVKSDWSGDTAKLAGKVMGFSFDTTLTVGPSKVGGEAPDPGMLLRGQAQKYLQRKFSDYLDPKRSLTELAQADD